MKLKLFSLLSVFFILSACNLNFSNSCDDVWVVTNNTVQPITINFYDTNTKEIIDAASVSGSNVTPSVKIFYHKADSLITIAESFHVECEASYSYSQSSPVRSLKITDQKQNHYEIINNSDSDVTFDLYIKLFDNTLSGGTKTSVEDMIQYTIPKGASINFIVYRNKPAFIFYKAGTTKTAAYTTETDTSGKIYIKIK